MLPKFCIPNACNILQSKSGGSVPHAFGKHSTIQKSYDGDYQLLNTWAVASQHDYVTFVFSYICLNHATYTSGNHASAGAEKPLNCFNHAARSAIIAQHIVLLSPAF